MLTPLQQARRQLLRNADRLDRLQERMPGGAAERLALYRADPARLMADAGLAPDEWQQLTVRADEGDEFPGWWRRSGDFVLTGAAQHALPAPVCLDVPALLDDAAPGHSWLQHPARFSESQS